MIKSLFCCTVAAVVFTVPVFATDSLVQRKPDTQAILEALGVNAWQMDFLLPQDHPTGLSVYVKSPGKAPVAINGTTIFRFDDGPRSTKITVTIAIQDIIKDGGERKLIVGASGGVRWTHEIENPFPPDTAWARAETTLKRDAKGRVLLAYSEGTRSLAPGRSIDDYPFAIYLELAPYEDKK